jgi:hypothetical protein
MSELRIKQKLSRALLKARFRIGESEAIAKVNSRGLYATDGFYAVRLPHYSSDTAGIVKLDELSIPIEEGADGGGTSAETIPKAVARYVDEISPETHAAITVDPHMLVKLAEMTIAAQEAHTERPIIRLFINTTSTSSPLVVRSGKDDDGVAYIEGLLMPVTDRDVYV